MKRRQTAWYNPPPVQSIDGGSRNLSTYYLFTSYAQLANFKCWYVYSYCIIIFEYLLFRSWSITTHLYCHLPSQFWHTLLAFYAFARYIFCSSKRYFEKIPESALFQRSVIGSKQTSQANLLFSFFAVCFLPLSHLTRRMVRAGISIRHSFLSNFQTKQIFPSDLDCEEVLESTHTWMGDIQCQSLRRKVGWLPGNFLDCS